MSPGFQHKFLQCFLNSIISQEVWFNILCCKLVAANYIEAMKKLYKKSFKDNFCILYVDSIHYSIASSMDTFVVPFTAKYKSTHYFQNDFIPSKFFTVPMKPQNPHKS